MIVWILFVAFLAFALSASAGLGGSLILVPMLILFIGTKQGIAVAALLLAGNNVAKTIAYREFVLLRPIGLVVVMTVVGAALGASTMLLIPEKMIRIGVLAMIATTLLVDWRGSVCPKPGIRPSWASLCAFGAGAASGISGTSGPLKGVALRALKLNRQSFVGAASVVSLFGDAAKVGVFAIASQYSGRFLILEVLAIPLMVAASFLGRRINKEVGERGYAILFWCVMIGYSIRLFGSLETNDSMSDSFNYFPAGVTNPDRSIGFIGHDDGILAIDLSNGAIIWQSTEASVPLAATPDRLMAQKVFKDSHKMRVIALDSTNGERIGDAKIVEFPNWIHTDPSRQNAVQIQANMDDDRLVMDWKARTKYEGGANPPRKIKEQQKRETHGKATLDFSTGKSSVVVDKEGSTEEEPNQNPSSSTVSYKQGGHWHEGFWTAPKCKASLSVQPNTQGQSYLSLNIDLKSRQRSLIKGSFFESIITPDGRYVIAAKSEVDPVNKKWHVFSIDLPDQLIEFNSQTVELPAVVNDVLYYLSSDKGRRGVVARTLDSGKVQWQTDLPAASKESTGPPPLKK